MVPGDLPAVEILAERLHPDHPERPEVFAERLALAPEGCRVLADRDGRVLGFALSHPWSAAAPPPLDSLLGALPARPDAWHLHDVALDPLARGHGHVAALLTSMMAVARARGIGWATLVAVPGLDAYWRAQGFAVLAPGPALAAVLAGYGDGACFMRRRLGT